MLSPLEAGAGATGAGATAAGAGAATIVVIGKPALDVAGVLDDGAVGAG